MIAPVSPAALIISTTTPDGPAALPDFILEMAFFTISMAGFNLGPVISSSRKLGRSDSQIGKSYSAKLQRFLSI